MAQVASTRLACQKARVPSIAKQSQRFSRRFIADGFYTAARYADGAQFGVDPLVSVRRRGPMVPLTGARIAYISGGLRRLREAATVLVNREHTDWIVPAADDELVAFPDVPVAAQKGPLLKDFTGQLWGIEPA